MTILQTKDFLVEPFTIDNDEKKVVLSARVSFDNSKVSMDKKDIRLTKYLVKHAHISTLFHNVFVKNVTRTFKTIEEAFNYLNDTATKQMVIRRVNSIQTAPNVVVHTTERFSLFAGLVMGYFRDCKEARKDFPNVIEAWEECEFSSLPVVGEYSNYTPTLEEDDLQFYWASLKLTLPFAIKQQFFKSDRGFIWWDDQITPAIENEMFAGVSEDLHQNEISRRYVDFEPTYTILEEWSKRPEKSIKQGAGELCSEDVSKNMNNFLRIFSEISSSYYNMALQSGVAPEEARFFLSVNSQTSFIQTGGLLDWARIWYLRSAPNAQKMIRDIAEEIDQILTQQMGGVWELAKEHLKKTYVKKVSGESLDTNNM